MSTPPRYGDRTRLLIFFVIAFVAPIPLDLAIHRLVAGETGVLTVRAELPARTIVAAFVTLATVVVARLERRSLAEYGMSRRLAGGRLSEGVVWGVLTLSVTPLALAETGHFRIVDVALRGRAALGYALAWATVFLALAIAEEFAFRGYLLAFAARARGFWPAAAILSFSFGIAHVWNPGETVLGLLQVVEIALFFCFTIRRTGTIWFAVGFHAAWDWAQSFLYGTPDSGLLSVGRWLDSVVEGPTWLTGGSAGPEGGVLALASIALAAWLISRRFPTVEYPPRTA